MRLSLLLTAIGLFTILPLTAQAESGFGTGFTEQSARAFEDPAAQKQDNDMAAAAAEAQGIEPAAGDSEEQGEEPNAINMDHQKDGHIFNGEIITNGTFIELAD